MAEEKVKTTMMVLKVDLECCKCYKKVKKVLAKFPQIRDQSYDFKANTVTIKVVCCSPEKIRDKICYKGGESIKSIEIKPPPPPPKPKESEKKPEKPPQIKSKPDESDDKPKEPEKKLEKKNEPPPALTAPLPAAPCLPIGFYGGGPCYYGGPPPPCYAGTYTYGRPVYDSWGVGGGGYKYAYMSRGDCFSEENPQACSIM